MKDYIEPSNIHKVCARNLPSSDIDHHCSDLYIRKTPVSEQIIRNFKYAHMVQTFIDNIDHDVWYDIPFCYDPSITTR